MILNKLATLFSLATTPAGLATANGTHRSLTPQEAYRKRMAKKRRKAQKEARRRNRK